VDDGLLIPVKLIRRNDVDVWFKRLADTVPLVRDAMVVTVPEASPAAGDPGQRAPVPPAPPGGASAPVPPEQTDALSRAIALMLTWEGEGHRYTVAELARAAGTSRATLYRDSRFQAARKAAKAMWDKPPKGRKDLEDGLDAYAPEDEDDG